MQFPYARLALDLVEIERVRVARAARSWRSAFRTTSASSIALDDVTSGLRHDQVLLGPRAALDQGGQRDHAGHRARPAAARRSCSCSPQVARDGARRADRGGHRVRRRPRRLRRGGRLRRAGLLPGPAGRGAGGRLARVPAWLAARRGAAESGGPAGARAARRPSPPSRPTSSEAVRAAPEPGPLSARVRPPRRLARRRLRLSDAVAGEGAPARAARWTSTARARSRTGEVRAGRPDDRRRPRRGGPRELVVRGLADRSIPKARGPRALRGRHPAAGPGGRSRPAASTACSRRGGDAGRPDRRERRERRRRKGW